MSKKQTDTAEDFVPDFKLEDTDIEFGKCPMCKCETFDLVMIDAFTKSALEESNKEFVYESTCSDCFILLKDQITQVGRMKAEKKQRLQELLDKWSTKIEVLKTGRALMSQKIYSEARKYFEEYIAILEAVYNRGDEGLRPHMIPEQHRKQESTLLCGLYCDLIFIYDKFEPGTARLKNMCDTLVEFFSYSRGQGSLLRKIKRLEGESKNKDVFKKLFQKAKNRKSSCFVATTVFDNNDAVELAVLRNFRDQFLRKSHLGRKLVYVYYQHSPSFSAKIKSLPTVKYFLKVALIVFCWIIDPIL